VDHAAQEPGPVALGGDQALGETRPEPGAPHAQGREELALGEAIEGHAGGASDDLCEHDEAEIAVAMGAERTERQTRNGGDRVLDALRFVLDAVVRRQPRSMRQESAQRDARLVRSTEFRDPARNGVVVAQPVLLDQARDAGGGRHGLGHGGEVEHRVRSHGQRSRLDRESAVGPPKPDPIAGAGDHDGARQVPSTHRGLDAAIHFELDGGREPHEGGRRSGWLRGADEGGERTRRRQRAEGRDPERGVLGSEQRREQESVAQGHGRRPERTSRRSTFLRCDRAPGLLESPSE